jgi:hypothetical protein
MFNARYLIVIHSFRISSWNICMALKTAVKWLQGIYEERRTSLCCGANKSRAKDVHVKIRLINHDNVEDNVMQLILVKIKWHIRKYLIQKYQSKNKKMYYHNEFDIYYRTALSLNLWRRVYCDVIDEWRLMQSL